MVIIMRRGRKSKEEGEEEREEKEEEGKEDEEEEMAQAQPTHLLSRATLRIKISKFMLLENCLGATF